MYNTISNMHRESHNQLDLLDDSLAIGGLLRSKRGNLVENIITYIWENEYNGVVKHNDYITDTSKNNFKIKKALDCHLYLDNKLVCCVEAKSYLDACYLARADWDAKIIKKQFKGPCIVLALENSLATDSLNYILDEENIDKVFFLCKGKRSSSKPLYKKEYFKEIDIELFNNFNLFLKGVVSASLER